MIPIALNADEVELLRRHRSSLGYIADTPDLQMSTPLESRGEEIQIQGKGDWLSGVDIYYKMASQVSSVSLFSSSSINHKSLIPVTPYSVCLRSLSFIIQT